MSFFSILTSTWQESCYFARIVSVITSVSLKRKFTSNFRIEMTRSNVDLVGKFIVMKILRERVESFFFFLNYMRAARRISAIMKMYIYVPDV